MSMLIFRVKKEKEKEESKLFHKSGYRIPIGCCRPEITSLLSGNAEKKKVAFDTIGSLESLLKKKCLFPSQGWKEQLAEFAETSGALKKTN